jgi:hypothetical protein
MPIDKGKPSFRAPRLSSRPTLSKQNRFSDGSDDGISQIDVQYNPDIIHGLLQDLSSQIDVKCALIEKDIEFMATSIQQAFQLELIKLPTQVKKVGYIFLPCLHVLKQQLDLSHTNLFLYITLYLLR